MSEYDQLIPATPARRDPTSTAQPGALAQIIERIGEAVELETEALRTDPAFDLAASNVRKSRHLYDLNRAMRTDAGSTDPDAVAKALESLRVKLTRNEAAIRAHMSAVSEVAGLIRDVIQSAEADGTYSSSQVAR